MKAGGGKVLMALGVVLALISGGVVFYLASTATAAPKEVPTKKVVVAKNEIGERTIITADLLQEVDIPVEVVPPGAILKLEDLVDKFAKDKIYAKMPIQVDQVAARKPGDAPAVQPTPAGGAASTTKPVVQEVAAAYTIPRGQTIVAVDYPEAAKLIATGILRPGDKVDIYVRAPGARGDQLALVFSNKEIKAVGNLKQTDKAESASATLLFIDTPQNALVLKYIETMNPYLLIRSAEDGEDARRTDLVTQEYIIARFGLQPPSAR